jgi:Fasciclin domain
MLGRRAVLRVVRELYVRPLARIQLHLEVDRRRLNGLEVPDRFRGSEVMTPPRPSCQLLVPVKGDGEVGQRGVGRVLVDDRHSVKPAWLRYSRRSSGSSRRAPGRGPHTIFAPTNGAFQMLKVGCLEPQGLAKTPEEQLQSADKDRLSEILKHYIVEGRIPFDQLIEQEQLETLQGAELDVSAAKGGVLVNKIEVLKPDIMADKVSST